MGVLLLIFTTCLFLVANSYDQKKKLNLNEVKEDKQEEELPTENVVKYYDNERIIIIGDSRMYGASQVVNNKDLIFIAKNGARCNYLWETAEKEVDKIMSENSREHFTILFNLGVNDLDYIARKNKANGKDICNVEQYSDYYIKLKEKWSEHNLFFISVNPVDEKRLKKGTFKNTKMTSNAKIEEFNDLMKEKLEEANIYYCDTYTKLMENGFESPDGLHYSDDTSKNIIQIVEDCSKKAKEENLKKDFVLLAFAKKLRENIVRKS